jgi:tetratricopeptide (TPR) repeat protein
VIAHICRRLDGIPLALELAAACLDALSTQQLASRVDRDLHLLAMGNRAALPRQQTLTAAIDWSYQLLTDEQRRVFERLSVFASGWTLEAAEAACAGDGVASEHVLDVVVQLIRKSLVVRVDDERYGLLETLRVYALEKLRERGQDFAATRERHAMYYSALMERLDPVAPTRLLTKRSDVAQVSVRQVVEEAHDNVRLALRWCLDTQRATEGLDFIRALGPLWIARGVPPDGRRWVEAMLELAERTPDPISRASQAQALMFGGISARVQRDLATAQKFLEHCVAIYRTLDDDLGLVYGLANLGINQFAIGDFVRADDTLSEGLALARSAGDANTISVVLTPLGTLATLRGQHDRATEFLYESATLGRTVHRPDMRRHLVGRALGFLGWALSEQRKFDAAMLVFEDALAGPEAPVAREMLSRILDWTAAIFGATGQPLRAARLFGAAETQWLASGAKRYPVDDMTYERDLRDVQAQLQNDEFAEAWAEGRAMTAEQAIAHALRET